MSDFTDFSEEHVLRWLFTTDDGIERPSDWQVSLHTADPGEGTPQNEVLGGSYQRQPVTLALPGDQTIDGGFYCTNVTIVEFQGMPEISGGDQVTHALLWGSVEGVWQPLGVCELLNPIELPVGGDTIRLDPERLVFEVR